MPDPRHDTPTDEAAGTTWRPVVHAPDPSLVVVDEFGPTTDADHAEAILDAAAARAEYHDPS